MELLVERAWPKETYTVGKFYIDGKRFGESMEDKDRGLNQSMSEAQIAKLKKYGETAIPKGRYEVKMTVSPKFSRKAWAKPTAGKVPEICCVPGYEGVRIHPLNSAKDSLGCIGVGKNDKLTLVGRGNTLGAVFALVNCYRAYGTPFGQAFAYRMVKMTLDRDTKCWHGLFVPALAIASM